MACQTRPGVAPYLYFIQGVTGHQVTQADWHDIRKLAAEAEGPLTRSRVTDVEAGEAAANLVAAVSQDTDMLVDPDGVAVFNACVNDMARDLQGVSVTAGTVKTINYLAEQGPEMVLARIAAAREEVKPVAQPTLVRDPKWDIQDAAAEEVEPLPDAGLLAALESAEAQLEALPENHHDRSEAQRDEWFRAYNRLIGIQSIARDRGLIDSHGERFDAEGYVPKFESGDFIRNMGTSKVGDLSDTSYNDLVRAFGEPTGSGDGDKVRAEWVLEFESPEGPVVATIHDWKTDESPRFNTSWSIGSNHGSADLAVSYVNAVIRHSN